MSNKDIPKRDQVLELLKEGGYTREEIAQKLDMTTASVSSQFTYLRWMGNYIIYDENKVLSLVDQDEYKAWQAAREANKKVKTSGSSKSPEEQAEALDKTIKNQEKQLTGWREKLVKIDRDLEDDSGNEELLELKAEAQANIVLLEIKIKRNKGRLENVADALEGNDNNDPDEEEDEEEDDLL